MKQPSKYFDSIRIKPAGAAESVKPEIRGCQWKGCSHEGVHRAPMGRGHEGHFYLFCADHIKQYNASYNYFVGMSEKAVQEFQKDALTGHRPTWKTGANAWAHGTRSGARSSDPGAIGGMTGKGNGPLKFFLTTLPADLTLLSRRNDGLFPFQRVMEVIDGRTGPTASPHGSREMPVWGKVYRDEASAAGDYPPEWAARVKLMALTDYLARIQER